MLGVAGMPTRRRPRALRLPRPSSGRGRCLAALRPSTAARRSAPRAGWSRLVPRRARSHHPRAVMVMPAGDRRADRSASRCATGSDVSAGPPRLEHTMDRYVESGLQLPSSANLLCPRSVCAARAGSTRSWRGARHSPTCTATRCATIPLRQVVADPPGGRHFQSFSGCARRRRIARATTCWRSSCDEGCWPRRRDIAAAPVEPVFADTALAVPVTERTDRIR